MLLLLTMTDGQSYLTVYKGYGSLQTATETPFSILASHGHHRPIRILHLWQTQAARRPDVGFRAICLRHLKIIMDITALHSWIGCEHNGHPSWKSNGCVRDAQTAEPPEAARSHRGHSGQHGNVVSSREVSIISCPLESSIIRSVKDGSCNDDGTAAATRGSTVSRARGRRRGRRYCRVAIRRARKFWITPSFCRLCFVAFFTHSSSDVPRFLHHTSA